MFNDMNDFSPACNKCNSTTQKEYKFVCNACLGVTEWVSVDRIKYIRDEFQNHLDNGHDELATQYCINAINSLLPPKAESSDAE